MYDSHKYEKIYLYIYILYYICKHRSTLQFVCAKLESTINAEPHNYMKI